MGCSSSTDGVEPGQTNGGIRPWEKKNGTHGHLSKQAVNSEQDDTTLTPPSGNFTGFAEMALREHNAYRAVHQVAPLVLSAALCAMSERLCSHLCEVQMYSNSSPQHRQHRGQECGESLFRHLGDKTDDVTADWVCRSWYDEVDNYHHDMPGFDLAHRECRHFTQMVWKKTRELGIAHGHYDDDDGFRKFIVVANYFPSGNTEGAYGQNVVIPKDFFDKTPEDATSTDV